MYNLIVQIVKKEIRPKDLRFTYTILKASNF